MKLVASRKPNTPRPQPRIKGIARRRSTDYLLPVVRHGLEQLARREGKTVSRIIAEIVSDHFDLDAATGMPLPGRKSRRRA